MLQEVIEGLIYAVFGTLAFCILIVVPLFVFGPSFESKLFPVIGELSIEPVDSYNKELSHYILHYTKYRECPAIPQTRAWYILQGKKEQRVSIVTTNKEASDYALPIGTYTSNVWEVDNRRFGPVDSQKLVLTYACHPFWMTQTVINIPIGLDK